MSECDLNNNYFDRIMDLFETVFLVKHSKDFGRIARASGGEYTEDDARNEAYILAYEIGERRGQPIDFSCQSECDLILGALSNKLVKRSDWNLKKAVRIHESDDDKDEERARIFALPAIPTSDPLVQMVAIEDMASTEQVLTSSFSQFRAYVVIFMRFDNDRKAICSYLKIHTCTLRRRFNRAEAIVRRQPSLFDRKKKIPNSFKPLPGRVLTQMPLIYIEQCQSRFAF